MANVDWRIRGPELATCNCDWGCPCQFNARPTHGNCRVAVGMRIDEGYFGNTRLDGLHWAALVAWPGAIHEGRGEVQPIVDERANADQREAILKIMAGEETEPGATMFNVFSNVIETTHEPLFLPIEFEADIEARTGRLIVPNIVEARGEPIRNPVTGAEHRARLVLPQGFEYAEAEFASSTANASGAISLDWAKGHAHFSMLHLSPQGVVR